MVNSNVMTNAAAHSHHSLRSIRRKLVRRTLVFSPSGLLTPLRLYSCNAFSFSAAIHAVSPHGSWLTWTVFEDTFWSSLCLHANHQAASLVPEMTRRNVLKDQMMRCAGGPTEGSPGPTVPPRTASFGLEQA